MDPKRWKQIDEVFQSAVERPAAERDAFVREACGDDSDLEREVRSMLARDESAAGFLSRPAMAAAADLTENTPVGRTIGRYRVIEQLGAGGMGVVYKAQDLELGRSVALKFLPEDTAQDTQALERLRREARAASSLNHPNICTIYEIGRDGDQSFIAMEYLDGITLKQRIGQGPLDAATLVLMAIEIADALEIAHAAGIIHRDIKSANIFLTSRGRVKVLDFGLAKLDAVPDSHALERSGPTRTMLEQLTMAGSLMGTIPYMSPEQVRGEPLDRRSDLFSFGVVLYEMATGVLPFTGQTPAVIDAIMNRDPVPPISLNAAIPAGLQRIILKCLEKNRDVRYQHASAIGADLQNLIHQSAATPHRWKVLAGIATVVMSAFGATYFYLHRAPKLSGKVNVVVAVRNSTGDSGLDGTLRQALLVELEQPPLLNVVADGNIRRALSFMRQPANARLTPELAREVCERLGSAALVEASIDRVGSRYELGIDAKNCSSGEVLFADQVQAERKEDVAGELHQIVTRFKTRAGDSLAVIQRGTSPLAEATTPSLEALKEFSAGREAISKKDARSGLHHFQRAVEIDPEFALAYAFLASTSSSLGDSAVELENVQKAWRLRDKASDHERFAIDHRYQRAVLGNLEKARQTCALWAENYPDDFMPHSFMAGEINSGVGRFDRAEEEGKRSIELDPNNAYGYHNLANSYILRNRTSEAEAVLKRAFERKLDIHEFLGLRHQIAFLKGDKQEMDRVAALGETRAGAENWIIDMSGNVLAYYGHLQQARAKWRRAIDISLATGHRDQAAQLQAGIAVREFLFGNIRESRIAADAAFAYGSKDRDAMTGTALALTFLEDSRSSTLIAELDKNLARGDLRSVFAFAFPAGSGCVEPPRSGKCHQGAGTSHTI